MKTFVMNYVAGVAVLTSALLAGCGDNLPTQNAAGSVIMPLKVGNMWIGRETTYDSIGAVRAVRLDTLKITNSVEEDGKRWFITNDGNAYFDGPEGMEGYRPIGLLAKYPSKTGDTFNIQRIYPVLVGSSGRVDTLIWAYKVFSDGEPVSVPAGAFTCHHYTSIALEPDDVRMPELHRYFAPNIGPVRIDEQDRGTAEGYLARRWELVKVVLK